MLSRNERIFEELCKDGLLLIESWRCMGRSDLFESIWCELVTTNHRTLEEWGWETDFAEGLW
jgi:hypothetical protein